MFGAFADVAPDDWGSSLIDDAYSKERTSDQPLSIGTFDHLVQLDDLTRMGALRFRAAVNHAADEDEISASSSRERTPTLSPRMRRPLCSLQSCRPSKVGERSRRA